MDSQQSITFLLILSSFLFGTIIGAIVVWRIRGKEQARSDFSTTKEDFIVLNTTLKNFKEELMGKLSPIEDISLTKVKVEEVFGTVSQMMRTLLGRGSGSAIESLLDEQLSVFPDGWIKRDVYVGKGKVEFCIPLPGGFIVPLDSKFVSAEKILALEKAESAKELENDIKNDVKGRCRELVKYITDSKTLGFGIAAIPDSSYYLCRKVVKEVAGSDSVVLVPYSNLVPFILSLYLLAQRMGITKDFNEFKQASETILTVLWGAIQKLDKSSNSFEAVQNTRLTVLDELKKAHQQLSTLTKPELGLSSVELPGGIGESNNVQVESVETAKLK